MTDMELMLAKANHVEEEKYPQLVEEEIKKTHKTSGNEIAILRKAIKALADAMNVPLPQEFLDYYNEIEGIKDNVKSELGMK